MWADWSDFVDERRRFDGVIDGWAAALDPAWLDGDLSWYSGSAKREVTRPRALLVTHFFNHQTHHRGQVHAALTGTRDRHRGDRSAVHAGDALTLSCRRRRSAGVGLARLSRPGRSPSTTFGALHLDAVGTERGEGA